MSQKPLYALHKIGKIAKPRDIFVPATEALRGRLIDLDAARELSDAELALWEKIVAPAAPVEPPAQQTEPPVDSDIDPALG